LIRFSIEKLNCLRSVGWKDLRMPTVMRVGPYSFYFFSHEPSEPPHIHVDRDERSAKFWLQPVGLARNFGFRSHELRAIQRIVEDNGDFLLSSWHGHFGTQR
jgi:hypothetical protein